MTHDGQQVWSKLNGDILRQVATVTDGAYIPAGTKQVNMADVYHSYIAKVEQEQFETAHINQYEARYQWFLGPALLLLLAGGRRYDLASTAQGSCRPVCERHSHRSTTSPCKYQFNRSTIHSGMNGFHKTIGLTLVVASAMGGAAYAADDAAREVAQQINSANGLLRDGKVDAAVAAYRQAQQLAPDRTDLTYDMAVAQYRKGDVASAAPLFEQAAGGDNNALATKARYNLGNCEYAAALRLAQTDHPAAIKGLERAIDNYRRSIDIDPTDADARANIELASALIDKLRKQDQQKQNQQKQNQQKQDQQKQDQQKQDQQKQDQQKQQSNQQQDQQSGKQKDQQSKNGQQKGSEKKDQKPGEQKDQQKSQDNQQPSSSASQDNQQKTGQPKEDEQKESAKSEKNDKSPQHSPDSKQQGSKSRDQQNQSQSKEHASQQPKPNSSQDKSAGEAEQRNQAQRPR